MEKFGSSTNSMEVVHFMIYDINDNHRKQPNNTFAYPLLCVG
jgi:hypothetical protein